LAQLNLFICLVGRYFDQSDLADAMKWFKKNKTKTFSGNTFSRIVFNFFFVFLFFARHFVRNKKWLMVNIVKIVGE
jgi:hypothetical protein